MKNSDIIAQRLINQQIADTKFKEPQQIVSWLIAMQAQEFAMAKWAIGLRLPGRNDADIENTFNEGTILRTHLLCNARGYTLAAAINVAAYHCCQRILSTQK